MIKNKKCKYITEIICLLEEDIQIPVDVIKIKVEQRPTFNTLLSYSSLDKWNIIANTDIYFDDTISIVSKYGKNDFLALTRYEIENNVPIFVPRADSQDSWIYYGIPKKIDANFTQGVLGCDNALCFRAVEAGYNVINPSITIKTYHLHSSKERDYYSIATVPGPHHFIWPTE